MKQLIRDEVAPQIEEAISDSGIIDEYTYDVSLQVLPTPQGPQPVLAIFLAVPNPAEIGTRLSAMTFVPGPIAPETILTTAVLGLINSLADQRREALGTGGGAPPASSGLILP